MAAGDTNVGFTPCKLHNGTNTYSWSTPGSNAVDGPEDGTVFTTFLASDLNTPGFAGANGWRLPTFAELQTILADFPCTGVFHSVTCTCASPCIAFSDSNTQSYVYWSATSYGPKPTGAWLGDFETGGIDHEFDKKDTAFARAVRGGL